MTPTDALRSLIERHVRTLRGYTDMLRGLVDVALSTGPGRTEAAARAIDLAHQMAGAGGSIGFMPVTVAAKSLELSLRPLAEGRAADRPAIVERFGLLRSIVAGLRPEQSSLYNVDLGQLASRRRAAE